MEKLIALDDSRATVAIEAVRAGNIEALTAQLTEHPELVKAHFGSAPEARTLLHILADWPGFLPNRIETGKALIKAGADVDARFIGFHAETPLHWAASNDDVELLDLLLDAGANIDAGGGVIAETPLADARAFLQLKCAHRLIERGAKVTLGDAATLGLMDHVAGFYAAQQPPDKHDTDKAVWHACHGGQITVAQYLYKRGADLNQISPWQASTPLDAAINSKATDLITWLKSVGAKASETKD